MGNAGSPRLLTASLELHSVEESCAELWMEFGWQRRCETRRRAHRSELGNGDATAAALSERGEEGNEHCRGLEDVAMEVMHARRADERGQRWCMSAKCRTVPAIGRPPHRLKLAIQASMADG